MLVLSVLCKLLRFKAGFAQSGRLVCALVILSLTGFVGNKKKRASYLHISGQSKQEHMGHKTVVCEQCGRWKPWLHFHQTAPVFVDLTTTCGSVSPGSQPSHVLTSGQHCSFFSPVTDWQRTAPTRSWATLIGCCPANHAHRCSFNGEEPRQH